MKRFGLFLAAICLVAMTAACGGSTNSTATGSGATITIANMSFGGPLTVPPGAKIAIKNNDSAEHSVTSDTAGTFDVEVDGKEQGTLTAPSAPGDYAFHCKYHSSMHGTLTVT
jgi:plastocyanin